MWNTKRLALIIAVGAIAIASALTFARGATTISAAKPPRPTGGVLAIHTGPAPSLAATPAASPSPTAAATPDASNAGGSTAATNTTSSAHNSTSAPKTPDCTTVARNASYQLGQMTYRQGDTVTGTTSIKNNGATCNLSNGTLSFTVKDGSTTLVQQTLSASSSATWAAGSTLTVNLSWSTKSCGNPCSVEPPGAYSASVTWPGLSALTQNFNLVAATTCDASAFHFSLNATPSNASAGTNISLVATVTNTSSQSCAVNDSTSLSIRDSGNKVIFGAGLGSTNNNQLLAPGQSLTYPYTWNGESCGGTCASGAYEATLVDTTYNVTVGPVTITLV